LAVIFTKSRFCVGHGAIGWSNQIEFGALSEGETAISNNALTKISGSQSNIGIVGLISPHKSIIMERRCLVNMPSDIGAE
jgi:hypothetical protein